VTNLPIDYYETHIQPFTQSVYPDRGNAALVGYDSQSPGPTFLIEKGRETVVRFINNATMANSVHLHGSYSVSSSGAGQSLQWLMYYFQRAPWDGWAEDTTAPGQFKDYFYPNSQSARMLWYHDHAMDHVSRVTLYRSFRTCLADTVSCGL
jgi:bilirubin oxidase